MTEAIDLGGTVQQFDLKTEKLRALIEGLRSLPNVADIAIINAICELDRIASIFEGFELIREEQRRRMAEHTKMLTDELKPRIMEAVERGENIIEATQRAYDEIRKRTCQCPACTAQRNAEKESGISQETSKGNTLQ